MPAILTRFTVGGEILPFLLFLPVLGLFYLRVRVDQNCLFRPFLAVLLIIPEQFRAQTQVKPVGKEDSRSERCCSCPAVLFRHFLPCLGETGSSRRVEASFWQE